MITSILLMALLIAAAVMLLGILIAALLGVSIGILALLIKPLLLIMCVIVVYRALFPKKKGDDKK